MYIYVMPNINFNRLIASFDAAKLCSTLTNFIFDPKIQQICSIIFDIKPSKLLAVLQVSNTNLPQATIDTQQQIFFYYTLSWKHHSTSVSNTANPQQVCNKSGL